MEKATGHASFNGHDLNVMGNPDNAGIVIRRRNDPSDVGPVAMIIHRIAMPIS